MIKTEIILLSNNVVEPFQDLQKDLNADFVSLNKLFATQSLAEHGLGFLINVFEVEDPKDEWGAELKKKIVFDVGSKNKTFLHNLDVRGYGLYDLDDLILSHWHYDHTGALYDVLQRAEKKIRLITHEKAKVERFFKRSKDVKRSDLEGKKREDIVPLLSAMKLVNQLPIDEDQVADLNVELVYSKDSIQLFSGESLTIHVSGEIPRNHQEEDFHNFFYLKEGILQEDAIEDDRCLIFEYEDHVVLLNGCCHSGLMNTMDYVRGKFKEKPISHVIGGFHMASAAPDRISKTIEYLDETPKYRGKLYLFPIHCTGDKFKEEVKKSNLVEIKIANPSVGTCFYM